jgi:hypothetical protein
MHTCFHPIAKLALARSKRTHTQVYLYLPGPFVQAEFERSADPNDREQQVSWQ